MPRVLWKQQSLERWSRVSEEKQEEEERGGERDLSPWRRDTGGEARVGGKKVHSFRRHERCGI